MRTARFLVLGSGLFFSWAATGQLPTDDVPRKRVLPVSKQLEQETEQARFRLGPLRLVPRFEVRDAGYNNNIFGTAENPVADWTATISGGVRYNLPLGAKTYVRGDLLPSYSWYAHHPENRHFGGAYNGSILGLFNRLTVEVGGTVRDESENLNSEDSRPVNKRAEGATGKLELELLRRLSVFGEAGTQTIRYRNTGDLQVSEVGRLDRTDSLIRGGVRYRLQENFDIGVQIDKTVAEYVNEAENYDNETTGYAVALHYDRPRLFVSLVGGLREGHPRNGSSYPEFQELTGSFFVSYNLTSTIELQAYGHRRPEPGLFVGNPFFIESRFGGVVGWALGRRFVIKGLGSVGSSRYVVPVLVGGTEIVKRRDDFTSVGGGLTVKLGGSIQLLGQVSREMYSSNIPGYDRSFLRFSTGLSFEGIAP